VRRDREAFRVTHQQPGAIIVSTSGSGAKTETHTNTTASRAITETELDARRQLSEIVCFGGQPGRHKTPRRQGWMSCPRDAADPAEWDGSGSSPGSYDDWSVAVPRSWTKIVHRRMGTSRRLGVVCITNPSAIPPSRQPDSPTEGHCPDPREVSGLAATLSERKTLGRIGCWRGGLSPDRGSPRRCLISRAAVGGHRTETNGR